MQQSSNLIQNYERLKRRMAQACTQAKRPPTDVQFIAVSKTQPIEKINILLEYGHRLFGENRVQEAKDHWQDIRQADLYSDLKLHLIGPLQRNKAKDAVALFDVIETIDRIELLDEVQNQALKLAKTPQFFVQVNSGCEPQKSGVLPDALPALLRHANQQNIPISGLMCIPPVDLAAGPFFAQLHRMALDNGLPHLSMGMSDDFEIAIRFGATHVRIGSALFGARF
jgi:PLP dependent protein